MYIRMVKKQIRCITLLIIILFTSQGLYSQESIILIGEDDLWGKTLLTNLSLIEGKRGYLDVTNSDNEYKPDRYTDMILSLNRETDYDKTGNYSFLSQASYIQSDKNLGGGAAYFDGNLPLIIEPGNGSLFSPSILWGDFSLEFRLLPATLKEGSTIFLWKGLHRNENRLIAQEIRCTVSNRQLVWDFENFFLSPDNSLQRISLSGDKLIPGMWTHHMITFDSETGLLEYKINNRPADSIYTSANTRESREFNVPLIGNQQSFPIELGGNFSGLIDEFRVSKRIIDNPVLNKFTNTGYLETDIVDMEVPGSTLLRIESETSVPLNTSIRYEYAISNEKLDLLVPDTVWTQFSPLSPINTKGRFIKIRIRLYSETATDNAPVLSNLAIIHKKAAPPFPPLGLHILRTDNHISLNWQKSINPEIKGYLVYIGEEPGKYFASGSPIDSGPENSIILNELNLNKRYYFSVTSYTSMDPRLESIFSEEISYNP